MDPDSILARTAREVLEAHAGGHGPGDGLTVCPACGERLPCAAGQAAAEVVVAAGLAEESGLVAASRRGLGEPYGEAAPRPPLGPPMASGSADNYAPVTAFGSPDAFEAPVAAGSAFGPDAELQSPTAFGSPIVMTAGDEPVRSEYVARRAAPDDDSPSTGPGYREARHETPVDISFVAPVVAPPSEQASAPVRLPGDDAAMSSEPGSPSVVRLTPDSVSEVQPERASAGPSNPVSLPALPPEHGSPVIPPEHRLTSPGAVDLAQESGLRSATEEPSGPRLAMSFGNSTEEPPETGSPFRQHDAPATGSTGTVGPVNDAGPVLDAGSAASPPAASPLPPNWRQSRPLDAPKFVPARPVAPRAPGMPGGPATPPAEVAGRPQSPARPFAGPSQPTPVAGPMTPEPLTGATTPRPVTDLPVPQPAAMPQPAAAREATHPAVPAGQELSGLEGHTPAPPAPASEPSGLSGQEPSGLTRIGAVPGVPGGPATPGGQTEPSMPAGAPGDPAAGGPAADGHEPSGLGQAPGYSGQAPAARPGPAAAAGEEPSGLPGRPAQAPAALPGLGNASAHFGATTPEPNSAPRAAMMNPSRPPLEAPTPGQANRPPAAGHQTPPQAAGTGPGEAGPRPSRPKLEAPNMGQLNKPLNDKDRPDR